LTTSMGEESNKRLYRDKRLRAEAVRILERAGIPKICVICGVAENLEVHHVDGYELHNSLENLRYLCRRCHHAVHTPEGHRGNIWVRGNACIICGRKYRAHKRLELVLTGAGLICEECFKKKMDGYGMC